MFNNHKTQTIRPLQNSAIFRQLVIAILVSCALALIGCRTESDRNQAHATTRSSLLMLAENIRSCHEAGIMVDDMQSVGDFLDYLEKFKVISNAERGMLERDGWGNDYNWSVLQDKTPAIRIMSLGKNGINDGGEGDDLVAEIQLLRQRKVQITITKPFRH